ncbi:radical SAM family heme chaperone HemW [Desulfobacterales bacterium HSG2]|nr:radical SAM family heme chaperone HemW [Desulfobacterales bacterium HSG2]
MKTEPSGIYIHIPFCIRKCPYCDFYSVTDFSLKPPFLKALMREMRMVCNVPRFNTLYIGGGTPSVLDVEDIRQIMEAARRSYNILPESEITIEANPGTVNPEKLRDYHCAGVNRINIGVQSLQDANLTFLGRIHSARDAVLAIRWARKAGFDNMGLDLIYGIPGQTKKSWLLDLQNAIEFEPEHLSCYMLTFEPDTPMDRDRRRGIFRPLNEHSAASLFKTTTEFLNDSGYAQYEISNFARSESERSRHNQKYWSDVPYTGLGPSAHSFTGDERYWNHRSVKRYIQDIIDEQRLPIAERELLTKEQRMTEAIYLGLRKTEGISVDDFDEKFGVSFNRMFRETIKSLEEEGFMKVSQKRCSLTLSGMVFLDSIASALVSGFDDPLSLLPDC